MLVKGVEKTHFRKQKTYLMHIYPGCNFRCKFCMAEDFIRDSPRPDWDALMADLDRLKKEGYVNVDIAGGEPTLYTRLPDLVAEIIRRDMNPMICTNGSMLVTDTQVQAYAKHRPLGFELSFHSHKADVFDMATKVKGSFDKAVKSIEMLQKHFDLYPEGEDPRIFLNTNTIITQYNYQDLEDILIFLYEKGVRIFRFSQLLLAGTALKEHGMLVSAQDMVPYLQKALKKAKELGVSYAIDRLPLCILPGEEDHFITGTIAGIKLNFCKDCELSPRCGGISKGLLMAQYGAELLKWQQIFPEGFFSPDDIAFLQQEVKSP
jgi:MoaA/NifB/PqqE/SkfB family radical SAM enzyme